jgi:hypothetical protein
LIASSRVSPPRPTGRRCARRQAEEFEDGSLDSDELAGEPDWWDKGSNDED